MPNRILRDWTDSAKFEGLSAEAERLFGRLLMKADDYGRYHSTPKLVVAGCFPLNDDVTPADVTLWLAELEAKRLTIGYRTGQRGYVAIVNFRQRLKRSVPKFPPMDGKSGNWLPDDSSFRELPGMSGNVRELPAGVGDGDGDECGDGKTLTGPPITFERAVEYLTDSELEPQPNPPYAEDEIRHAYLALNTGGWMWGKRRVSDPFSAISTKIEDNRRRPGATTPGRRNGPNI